MKIAALLVSYGYPVKIEDLGLDPGIPLLVVDNAAPQRGLVTRGKITVLCPGKNIGFAGAINMGLQYFGWQAGKERVSQVRGGEGESGRQGEAGSMGDVSAGPRRPGGDIPELVFVLNPDARIVSGRLGDAAPFFEEDPELGVLGPLVLDPDGTVQASARSFPTFWQGLFNRASFLTRLLPRNRFTAKYLMPLGDIRNNANPNEPRRGGTRPARVDWVSACAVYLRREAVEAVAGFDEGYFMYVEDMDLCRRLREKGWKTAFAGHPTVVHAGGLSARKNPLVSALSHHRSLWRYYNRWMRRNPLEALAVGTGIVLRLVMQLARPW